MSPDPRNFGISNQPFEELKLSVSRNIYPVIYRKGAFSGLFTTACKALIFFGSAVLVALVLGYVWFSFKVADQAYSIFPDKADGIVVLTGDAGRLETAFDLMDAKRAKRLLISGVHRDTSRLAILNAIGRERNQHECCVDLDHVAMDTAGNAKQTAKWASQHHYDKLIIVSSNYHLPRTMIEMQAAMPQAELIAYQANTRSDALVNSPAGTMQFTIKEYAKFIAAALRISLFG